MSNSENLSKIKLALSMVIFGTIGLVVRNISLPSSFVAFSRGLIGSIILILFFVFKKKRLNVSAIKLNIVPLLVSGFVLGLNWILLFEAYKYTTVATATLCYYMAPVFVIAVTPILLKEKVEIKRVFCILISLVGMMMVSGISDFNAFNLTQFKGVILGVGAAVLYCCIVISNKMLKNLPSEDMTVVQLAISAFTMIVYVLLTEDVKSFEFDVKEVCWLVVAGVLHTGIAYLLYFASVNRLKAQTTAVFSFIDPLVAVAVSVFVLKEEMTFISAIGAVLILGSTLFSEIKGFGKKSNG